MPFKPFAQVLEVRFRFPGCHTYRPLAQSVVSRPVHPRAWHRLPDPTHCRGAPSLAGAPTLLGGRVVTASHYWPKSTSLHSAGRLVPVRICDWCAGRQARLFFKGGLAGAAVSQLGPFSSWPTAGDKF